MSFESHELEQATMSERPAYLKPLHPHAYTRPDGEFPVIEGVVLFTSLRVVDVPCFKVRYKDGFTDFVAVSSLGAGHYVIVPEAYYGE
jgi:hypothetical protein